MSKKPLTFLICDDDDYNHEMLTEDVLSVHPNANITLTKTLDELLAYDGSIDILIIDISAICPIMEAQDKAYIGISRFLDKHPGTTVFIRTAIAGAEYVKEDVLERNPDADVRVIDIFDDFCKAMETIL